MQKRKVDVVVISDVHLGTYGCHANELLNYLGSISPKTLVLNGDKCWIFHGDVFDVTMRHSKWLARLGAVGYDILILINRFVNYLLRLVGREKISLSKRIKDSVKSAIRFVDDFEQTATDLAIENGYQYVVCGHIHKPQLREYKNEQGSCTYLNSGDWVENLTALEYDNSEWRLHRYQTSAVMPVQMNPYVKTPQEQALEVA